MKALTYRAEHALRDMEAYPAEDADDLASLLSLDYDFNVVIADVQEDRGLVRMIRLRSDKPLIAITSGDERVQATCLNDGADYVMVWPIHRDMLDAMVRAAIRRYGGRASNVIEVSDLTLDQLTKTLYHGERRVHLTNTEYTILSLLMENAGDTVSKERILNTMYPLGEDTVEPKIVDVFICKLRKKLDNGIDRFETIWGQGYRMRRNPIPKRTYVDAKGVEKRYCKAGG